MRQAEFPPPEMHERQQKRQNPAEMHEVNTILAGMLHEAGGASQKPRYAETDHHAHHDANVDEDFDGRRLGLHGGFRIGQVSTHPRESGQPINASKKKPDAGNF
jgi:hypothetical protein